MKRLFMHNIALILGVLIMIALMILSTRGTDNSPNPPIDVAATATVRIVHQPER